MKMHKAICPISCGLALGLLMIARAASAVVSYDQDITPDVIFGSGNSNGFFTVDRSAGVELGLRAKIPVAGITHSNGDGSYTYTLSELVAAHPDRRWTFNWSVNTDWDGSSGLVISDLAYLLQLDFDPGPGSDFLAFDPITPSAEVPYFDHSIGTNATANGAGVEASDAATYASLIAANNVAQNSWRHGFFPFHPTLTYDSSAMGTYDVVLSAFDGGTPVAIAAIKVHIVCGTNADCDDAVACNGAEVCDLGSGACVAGSVPDCASLTDQCNVGGCTEPAGCEATPVVDGTTCDLADSCSAPDRCQSGVCEDTGGGDPDADGLCSYDDNCPADSNPGQEDTDFDGLGDACDMSEGGVSMTLSRVKLQSARVGANRPNGHVLVKALVLDALTGGILDQDLLDNDDVSMTVTAGLFVSTIDFRNCERSGSGAIKCRDGDAKVKFRPLPRHLGYIPDVYLLRVKTRHDTQVSAPTAPVTVVLFQPTSSVERSDGINTCVTHRNGATLVCKEAVVMP